MIDETTMALKSDVFHYFCDLEIKKAQRYQYYLSLLIIQFDFSEGEEGLNAVLEEGKSMMADLGEILRDEIRESDLVGRVSDKRISILLPFTDGSTSKHVAERIRNRIENHSFHHDIKEQRTVSVGVACYPTHAIDSLALINQADETLLRAMNVGGNRVFCAQ